MLKCEMITQKLKKIIDHALIIYQSLNMLSIILNFQQKMKMAQTKIAVLVLFCSLFATIQSLEQGFPVTRQDLGNVYPSFVRFDQYGNYLTGSNIRDHLQYFDSPEIENPTNHTLYYQGTPPFSLNRIYLHKNSLFAIIGSTNTESMNIQFYIARRDSINEQFSSFFLFYTKTITGHSYANNLQMSQDANFICFTQNYYNDQYLYNLTLLSLDITSDSITVINSQALDLGSKQPHTCLFTQDSKLLAYSSKKGDIMEIYTMELETFTKTFVSTTQHHRFTLTGISTQYQIAFLDQVINEKVTISISDSSNIKVVDKFETTIAEDAYLRPLFLTSDFRFLVIGSDYAGQNLYIVQITQNYQLVVSQVLQTYKSTNALIKYKFSDGEQDRVLIPQINYQDPVFPFNGQLPQDLPMQPVDCSLDRASTGQGLTQFECQCHINYYWDNFNRRCSAICNRGFALESIQGNPLKCRCKEGSVWDAQTSQCLINCRKVKYSTGQWVSKNICECCQNSRWNPLNLTCQPKCISHSTGELVDKKCTCEEGYTWIDEKGVCQKDCSIVENTKYSRPIGSQSCQCNIGVWQGDSCRALDCNQISYRNSSSSHPQQSEGICDCENGFLWDSDEVKCKLDCTNKSDSLTKATNLGENSCQCQIGAIWNEVAMRCFVNCSADINSLNENINYQECVCKDRFRWSSSDLACKSTCGERLGEQNSFNDTKKRCNCLAGFQYYQNSPEGGACYRSCSAIDHTDSYFGSQPNSCICEEGFKWDESNLSCELSCDGLYDLGVNADDSTVCDCLSSNTYFIEAIGKCMPICVNDALSIGLFNQDTFGCNCKKNAKWVISTASCTCDTDYSEVDGQCVAPDSSLVIIPIAIGGAVCSGGAILAGMIIRQKRKEAQEVEKEQNVGEEK